MDNKGDYRGEGLTELLTSKGILQRQVEEAKRVESEAGKVFEAAKKRKAEADNVFKEAAQLFNQEKERMNSFTKDRKDLQAKLKKTKEESKRTLAELEGGNSLASKANEGDDEEVLLKQEDAD